MHGISTILALILLVIIVVALVGLTYSFAVNIFGTVTGAGENTTEKTTEKLLSRMIVESISGSKIYIRNTGLTDLSDFTILINEKQADFTVDPPVIGPNEIGTIIITDFIKEDDEIKILSTEGAWATEKAPDPCEEAVLCLKFEEGLGTTAKDSSSYGNDGTLANMDSDDWVDGKYGKALSFDGSDDYVSIPNVNPTTAITVEAWVKSSTATGYSGVWQIVSKYSAYILGTSSTGGKEMCFIIYDTTWRYGSCYTVPDPENWHHFVGTYDSSAQEKKIYVDSVLRDTTNPSGTINPDTGTLHIAHREGVAVGSGHFNGTIDEVRIYNKAIY